MLEPFTDAEVQLVLPGRRARGRSGLSRLRDRLAGGRRAQSERFASAVGLASKLDRLALLGLVRLFGRSVQSSVLGQWMEGPSDFHPTPDDLLFPMGRAITPDGLTASDLFIEVEDGSTLSLARDVVLPAPWNACRLERSLTGLSPEGKWGEWTQDENHSVTMWLPMRIAWVHGGNHSIAAGIAHGTGEVRAEVVFDVSRLYDHVVCDGLHFRRASDDKVISPVQNFEMAVIFEIGRRLHILSLG